MRCCLKNIGMIIYYCVIVVMILKVMDRMTLDIVWLDRAIFDLSRLPNFRINQDCEGFKWSLSQVLLGDRSFINS